MTEQDILKSQYSYNPDTGIFVYALSRSRFLIGEIAGCSTSKEKYVRIHFEGKSRQAHRLAFLYMTGKWPEGLVDHLDGDKHNNRWDNLRDTTASVNSRNRLLDKRNKSGITGVRWCKTSCKWEAYIYANGKSHRLGSFVEKEDAITARMTGELRFGYFTAKLIDQENFS